MEQFILHLIGDYWFQSDWMAKGKRFGFVPCFAHCLLYTLCFLFLTSSPICLGVIFGTHFLIDFFGLARFLVWAKNHIAPAATMRQALLGDKCEPIGMLEEGQRYPSWDLCKVSGYDPRYPAWLAIWLTIITDNSLHLICNYLVLRYL